MFRCESADCELLHDIAVMLGMVLRLANLPVRAPLAYRAPSMLPLLAPAVTLSVM